MNNELVLFNSQDGEVSLPVSIDYGESEIWLTRNQMSELYDRDVKTIGKHVNNALNEELEGAKNRVVANFAITAADGKTYRTDHYGLDVVLSVGYRVKSQRGVEFRRWATQVLRQHIIEGHTENQKRLQQLGMVAQVMKRLEGDLQSGQILDVVESYTRAFTLLDEYDRKELPKPKGTADIHVLTYEECRTFIDGMRFMNTSELFGNEKDDSFRSSIAAVYAGFDGIELYPSVEEKAANLLYFIVKNHSFSDGNKRIGAGMFLYFLDRNNALFIGNQKRLADATLVALTIMIAESRPDEKEAMVSLVLNFLD